MRSFLLLSLLSTVVFVDASSAQFASPRWADEFGSTGVSGGGAGSLYFDGEELIVAGIFYVAGDAVISNVTSFDPESNTWSSIVGEIEGSITSVAIGDDGDVYVAGASFTAGGMTNLNIAGWNGSEWYTLGDGLDRDVFDLAYYKGRLYAVGAFTSSGSQILSGVAAWDGETWDDLDGGLRDPVFEPTGYAVEVDAAGRVFVGGHFRGAGSTESTSFAIWEDGQWHAPSSPLSSTDNWVSVLAISLSEDEVLLGGTFTHAGGQEVSHVVRYENDTWYQIGQGLPDAAVTDITRHPNGDVIVIGHMPPNASLARFDGDQWQLTEKVGSQRDPLGLEVLPTGQVVVGHVGLFFPGGGNPSQFLYAWDPVSGNWGVLDATQKGIDGPVHALIPMGDGHFYAGGNFDFAGSTAAQSVAYWNGSEWEALGAGLEGSVEALAIAPNGDLYAGGQFFLSGDLPLSCIARWDGDSWHPLDAGVTFPSHSGFTRVHALEIHQGELYVGGLFTHAGATSSPYLATWSLDELAWTSSGAAANGPVHAFWSDQARLAAGGEFTRIAPGVDAPGIALRENGVWSAMGRGSASPVYAVTGGEARLYASGSFGDSHIGSWDGTTWEPTGIRLPEGSIISAMMKTPEGPLYVGGDFSGIEQADGTFVESRRIAIVDGGRVERLEGGAVGIVASDGLAFSHVHTIAGNAGDLLVGGEFMTVGALPDDVHGRTVSVNVAIYQNATHLSAGGRSQLPGQTVTAEVYPNPTRGNAILRATAPMASSYEVSVYDVLGRRVHAEVLRESPGTVLEAPLDLAPLPAGAYVLRITPDSMDASTAEVLVVKVH